MSVCERCWTDAQAVGLPYSVVLMRRRDTPCSPEDQAGPGAGECPRCRRKTLHQHTAEPMCGCPPIFSKPSAEAIEAIRASLEPGEGNP